MCPVLWSDSNQGKTGVIACYTQAGKFKDLLVTDEETVNCSETLLICSYLKPKKNSQLLGATTNHIYYKIVVNNVYIIEGRGESAHTSHRTLCYGDELWQTNLNTIRL